MQIHPVVKALNTRKKHRVRHLLLSYQNKNKKVYIAIKSHKEQAKKKKKKKKRLRTDQKRTGGNRPKEILSIIFFVKKRNGT